MQYMANERTGIVYPYDEEFYEEGGFRPLNNEELIELGLDPTDEQYYESTRLQVPENIQAITRDYIISMFNEHGDALGKRIGNDVPLREAQEEMLVRIIQFNQKQSTPQGEDLPLPENFNKMRKSQLEKFTEEQGFTVDMTGSVSQVRARVVNHMQDQLDKEAA